MLHMRLLLVAPRVLQTLGKVAPAPRKFFQDLKAFSYTNMRRLTSVL